MRFPGQYHDEETGLHYNWHRYYNPATGRYITSDPIGLAGGLNTFGYVGQSPLTHWDPNGLFQFGTRPLSGLSDEIPVGNTNIQILHENGFLDSGGDVGFFPEGIRPDDPSEIENYTMFGPYYDDQIIGQTVANLINSGLWTPTQGGSVWDRFFDRTDYDLLSRNCQDFSDALRGEYKALGGETCMVPF